MLPPGHFAAGYLTGRLAVIQLAVLFPQASEPRFLAIGILASLLPDLDDLYAFWRIGRPIAASKGVDHRKFISHAPLLHLAIAVAGYFAGWRLDSGDLQLYSILYLVGTWTHFVFDSFGYGIMWLWPVSKRLYSVFLATKRLNVSATLSTARYWLKFLREYLRSPPFIIELFLIVFAAIVFIKF